MKKFTLLSIVAICLSFTLGITSCKPKETVVPPVTVVPTTDSCAWLVDTMSFKSASASWVNTPTESNILSTPDPVSQVFCQIKFGAKPTVSGTYVIKERLASLGANEVGIGVSTAAGIQYWSSATTGGNVTVTIENDIMTASFPSLILKKQYAASADRPVSATIRMRL